MSKRRITLNLDSDLVADLEALGKDSSMSAVANEALRNALESRAHRVAMLAWLEELNEGYGAPTAEEYAEARALLDEVTGREPAEPGAA